MVNLEPLLYAYQTRGIYPVQWLRKQGSGQFLQKLDGNWEESVRTRGGVTWTESENFLSQMKGLKSDSTIHHCLILNFLTNKTDLHNLLDPVLNDYPNRVMQVIIMTVAMISCTAVLLAGSLSLVVTFSNASKSNDRGLRIFLKHYSRSIIRTKENWGSEDTWHPATDWCLRL